MKITVKIVVAAVALAVAAGSSALLRRSGQEIPLRDALNSSKGGDAVVPVEQMAPTPPSPQVRFSGKLPAFKDNEKRLYHDAVAAWIYDSIHTRDSVIEGQVGQWAVNIYEGHEVGLEQWQALHVGEKLNAGIPFGMTLVNIKSINVFIPNVSGPMAFQQNFNAIAHELDHMLLSIYYPTRRAARRHDDGIASAGTAANFYTTEVHDRLWEINHGLRRNKVMVVALPDASGPSTLVGIDVDDLLGDSSKPASK